jgi:hypothetical protein
MQMRRVRLLVLCLLTVTSAFDAVTVHASTGPNPDGNNIYDGIYNSNQPAVDLPMLPAFSISNPLAITALQRQQTCIATTGIACSVHSDPHTLPPAPQGKMWQKLDGDFSFSAYAQPTEESYMGNMVYVPGAWGVMAKEGFLYGVDGIGMQGGGYIWRKGDDKKDHRLYIKYISGHWELDGRDVNITDHWYYKDNGEIVDTSLISKIRLSDDAKFSVMPDPELSPYYSVAAPSRFDLGTKIFVPGLKNYNEGVFEIQDRGGAFESDSQRFDIYVGQDLNRALEFLRLGPARSNLDVYQLVPVVSDNNRGNNSPQAQANR